MWKIMQIIQRFLSQQSNHVKIGMIGAFIIIIAILLVRPNSKEPTDYFENFSSATNTAFEEITSISRLDSNHSINANTQCRKFASMIQRSPAFELHGCQIAIGLREFGEKIMLSNYLLQKMYSKGSEVYKSFDIEIEAMIKNSKGHYFNTQDIKTSLNKLITIIKEFRKLVEKTQSSINNAEEIRHDTEGYIHDGLREADNFIKNSDHTVDLETITKEIEITNELLNHLNNAASHLDKMKKILMTYEDNLLSVSGDLDNAKDTFEATEADFMYLKSSVNILKASHLKFIQKSLTSC